MDFDPSDVFGAAGDFFLLGEAAARNFNDDASSQDPESASSAAKKSDLRSIPEREAERLENLRQKQLGDIAKMATLPNREIHEGFMKEAIAMADLALRSDETPVGCVFVHKGEIIGRGMNHTNKTLNGTRHAEFVALAEILQTHAPAILKETDLYVTVEPCIMCASALRQFNIRCVYFGCFNDRFGGTGGVLRIHEDENVDPPYPAFPGIFRDDAIMLLRKFYIQENEKAPEPKQKKTRELKTEIIPLDLSKV
ncbi:cytidine deaminase-like protein [Microthyrium microscopicum]|uniref:tRNA(adenine(34)) deaminase n=1 Tax=Microthyrium microscopicum TaxID=703497 RepID=A0A6A6URD2_9PEZI|nr:cytidine deaminase-like protein [Microthyrium microscopicum]